MIELGHNLDGHISRTSECLEVHNLSSFTAPRRSRHVDGFTPFAHRKRYSHSYCGFVGASLRITRPSGASELQRHSNRPSRRWRTLPSANPNTVQMPRSEVGALEACSRWRLFRCEGKWWGELITARLGTTAVRGMCNLETEIRFENDSLNLHLISSRSSLSSLPVSILSLTCRSHPSPAGERRSTWEAPSHNLGILEAHMWAVVSSCGNRKSVQSYSHLEAGITEASWSTGEDGQWIAALEVEFDDHRCVYQYQSLRFEGRNYLKHR